MGSHDWGREGSGDCGIRVVIEESGAKRRGGLFRPYLVKAIDARIVCIKAAMVV